MHHQVETANAINVAANSPESDRRKGDASVTGLNCIGTSKQTTEKVIGKSLGEQFIKQFFEPILSSVVHDEGTV
jgi:hypothetical protein